MEKYKVYSTDPAFISKALEYQRAYYNDPDHRKKAIVRALEWARNNPEGKRLQDEKRRVLKYDNTPVSELLTEAQWRDILDEYHHRCAYCGKKMDKLTIDHVNPLSKGGKHSASNVVPSCRSCNSKKNAKTPEEWCGMAVVEKARGA